MTVSRIQGGLAHIIKKDRLSTRNFVVIFRVVSAVQSGNVVPYSLVEVPPSPCAKGGPGDQTT